MLGVYVNSNFGPRYYGKAVNISRRLTAAYDKVLADYDLLLMPTTPMKATPLPAPGAPARRCVARAFEMIANTAPFDITHHPAMSMPCGMVDGLPVGLMLIGRHSMSRRSIARRTPSSSPATGRKCRQPNAARVLVKRVLVMPHG